LKQSGNLLTLPLPMSSREKKGKHPQGVLKMMVMNKILLIESFFLRIETYYPLSSSMNQIILFQNFKISIIRLRHPALFT